MLASKNTLIYRLQFCEEQFPFCRQRICAYVLINEMMSCLKAMITKEMRRGRVR